MSVLSLAADRLRTLPNIRQDIAENAQSLDEAHRAEARIPSMTSLAQRLTIEATVDPSRKPDLVERLNELHALEDLANTLPQLRRTRDSLRVELAAAEAEEHAAKVREHSARIQSLRQEFNLHAMNCCRTYERILQQQRANSFVQGADTAIPSPFTFSGYMPTFSEGFSTSDLIRSGSLAWLNLEKDSAA